MARRVRVLALLGALAVLACVAHASTPEPTVDDAIEIVEMEEEAGAHAPADAAPEPTPEAAEPTPPEPEPEPVPEPKPAPTPSPPPKRTPSPPASDAKPSSAAEQLSFNERMFAGSTARLAASIVLHPFDTLRTRAQARKRASTASNLGVLDIFVKGIVPQVALAMPAGAVQFATLEYAREALAERVHQKATRNLLSSAAGALAASVIRVPQEVLKQPVQAGLYPNCIESTRAVCRQGIGRLYRGFGATVLRDVPWNSLGYTFWQLLKVLTRAPNTATADLVLGGVGGAIAAIILTPMDVAKTRLMTQSASDAVQYRGTLHALGRVAADEGVPALFRGVLPRILYLAPLASIVYSVYEMIARWILAMKARPEAKDGEKGE